MYGLEGTGSPSTYNTYLRAFFHNFTARVVSYAVTTYVVSVKSGWFRVVVEEGRLELNMDKKKYIYTCVSASRRGKGKAAN